MLFNKIRCVPFSLIPFWRSESHSVLPTFSLARVDNSPEMRLSSTDFSTCRFEISDFRWRSPEWWSIIRVANLLRILKFSILLTTHGWDNLVPEVVLLVPRDLQVDLESLHVRLQLGHHLLLRHLGLLVPAQRLLRQYLLRSRRRLTLLARGLAPFAAAAARGRYLVAVYVAVGVGRVDTVIVVVRGRRVGGRRTPVLVFGQIAVEVMRSRARRARESWGKSLHLHFVSKYISRNESLRWWAQLLWPEILTIYFDHLGVVHDTVIHIQNQFMLHLSVWLRYPGLGKISNLAPLMKTSWQCA